MGVTIVQCEVKDCGRPLNGELCNFAGGRAHCAEHIRYSSETHEQLYGFELEQELELERRYPEKAASCDLFQGECTCGL